MKSNVKKKKNGSQYLAKRKKMVTKQYDKKLFILFYCKFPSTKTQCQNNEGFWEISYMRVICNLLLKCQKKKGWKFPTPCQTCLSSSFLSEYSVGAKNSLKISTTIVFSSKVVQTKSS